ncbi:hypothetical protein FO488_16025 [Geobacter sp. FeAm09]|uniref:hypothetical protein n=1 Tax=Geobacter sp. FeAm09 TaxID=2597769 RepID=UPI0011ECF214|nr:hypothetical protein [Geobacter sp. FeAm09]QEM69516.1 hypothetical protein FO488_16025 [Geobacter sp. FeAm09]
MERVKARHAARAAAGSGGVMVGEYRNTGGILQGHQPHRPAEIAQAEAAQEIPTPVNVAPAQAMTAEEIVAANYPGYKPGHQQE